MNLFEVFVKIGADTKGAMDGIAKVGAKVADFGKSAAKITLKATTAAAAGITALTTAAVKQYADYEQLVGGIETLFKESAAKMMKYADEAYKTAGLSANKYMETVTSFSASLLASVGGDTERAAEQANKAIVDMSDNANKMGTSIEMIQNAYRGFAKQNFTMLDNLSIGYGGTKEEMERLLADAEKLSGQKYDISSYSDIVDAIHVVQTEMGITGTTAKEAATTISGSVASMKAAFGNLVVGLADDTQDFDALLNNAVEATDTALGNILPRVETTIGGITSFVEKAIPTLMDRVPALITSNLPKIANAAKKTIESFLKGIRDSRKEITSAALEIVSTLGSAITDDLPILVDVALDLILSLAGGIVDNLDKIGDAVGDCVDKIIDTLSDPENIAKLLDSGLKIVVKLVEGIIKAIPKLIKASAAIVKGIFDYLSSEEGAKAILNGAKDLLLALGSALVESVYVMYTYLDDLVAKIAAKITGNKAWEAAGGAAGRAVAQGMQDGLKFVTEGSAHMGGVSFTVTGKKPKAGLGTADARKEQTSRMKAIADAVKSGAKKIASTVTEISEEAKKKLEKAQSEFISFFEDSVKDAIDLENEYQSTLEKRKDAIKASYDIFDEVEQKAQTSEKKRILNGYQLIQNLYAQNLAIEEFYANVEKLRARGVSEGLVEEFIGKGIASAEELKALLAIDDEDLAEYEAQYRKRNEIAERYSNIQLEGLKNETQKEIDAIFGGIDESYNNAATTLGGNFVDKLVAAIKSGAPEIAEALKLATSQALDMNALVSVVNSRLGSNYALDKRGAMA